MNIIFKFSKKRAVYFLITALSLIIVLFTALSFKEIILLNSNEERTAYLISLGYNIDVSSEVSKDITIPISFSNVYNTYNELLKKDGFDLTDYRGSEATVYTYCLNNCTDVFVTIIVSNGKLIGGDVHESRLDGTMLPLISGADYEFGKT